MVTHDPLHRSRRAELPHRALASGVNAQALVGIGMNDPRRGQPAGGETVHPRPGHAVFLTTAPQRPYPQAHNLAIVINELATNTIQHTLPGRSTARINVRVALEDDAILFEYRDDGPGYPEDVLQLERHAVGFDLIRNLVRQSLRGELSLHNDEGAVAVIRFPTQA